MATKAQLKDLAQLRLREAEALFDAGLYDGCAYLCGYVVELALKARICATLNLDEYPQLGRLKDAFWTHNLDDLKLLAGMQNDPAANTSAFLTNWSFATKWRPERRYEPQGSYNRVAAQEILDAVRTPPDGVLPCISSRW